MQAKILINAIKFSAGIPDGTLNKYANPPTAIKSIIDIAKYNTAQLSAPYFSKLICSKLDSVPMNTKTIATNVKHEHKKIKKYLGTEMAEPILAKFE